MSFCQGSKVTHWWNPQKTLQTKLVATFWQGCWNTLSDPSCQQQLPYLFLPLLGLSAWFCTTCWCSVMVPWHWEPNNFFIAHVGILGKYVLVLHFCIGETQIGETNGTNTELLKSPMQALLTRAAGVEKTCKMHEWAGASPFGQGCISWLLQGPKKCNQSTLLSRIEKPPI